MSVEALALVASAVATFLLALFTARLAAQGRNANQQAERLYTLQSLDIERREKEARPQLQLFDVRLDQQQNVNVQLFQQTLLIELINFGRRPARIQKARLSVGEKLDEQATAWGSSSVRHNEIVRLELSAALKKYLAGVWGQAVKQSVAGEEVSKPDLTGNLEVTYSEVDGSNSRTDTFTIPFGAYRSRHLHPDFIFRVVGDGETRQ